jgi:hypothetical protein
MKNSNKPWTPKDLSTLRQLARRRLSSRLAAAKLGRSNGATRYKAMCEGISFRSINRRAR